jgi:myo-inositol-1(or 4)-monophosphatase
VVGDCQRSTEQSFERSYATELRVARAAAEAAGQLLVAAFAGTGGGAAGAGRRHRNGPHDVVTALDARTERRIASDLRAAFPRDGFVGEERRPRRPTARGGLPRTWIVDPIDGTVMFASGIPFFSISIALSVGSAVLVGVVHDPVHRETFWATAGAGAWLDGGTGPAGTPHQAPRRLRVRRLADAADAVVTLDPGDPDDTEALHRIESLRSRVRVARSFGSTALSLAWLAAGRVDGVLQVHGLQGVDIAGGGLLALEAGARVTDASGGLWLDLADLGHGRGIAAAGPTVHGLLVERPTATPSPCREANVPTSS